MHAFACTAHYTILLHKSNNAPDGPGRSKQWRDLSIKRRLHLNYKLAELVVDSICVLQLVFVALLSLAFANDSLRIDRRSEVNDAKVELFKMLTRHWEFGRDIRALFIASESHLDLEIDWLGWLSLAACPNRQPRIIDSIHCLIGKYSIFVV